MAGAEWPAEVSRRGTGGQWWRVAASRNTVRGLSICGGWESRRLQLDSRFAVAGR